MRISEQSPSGAVIEIRGTRRNVLRVLAEWREHHAGEPDEVAEPERTDGPMGTESRVEHAGRRTYEADDTYAWNPVVNAKRPFGFTMNVEAQDEQV